MKVRTLIFSILVVIFCLMTSLSLASPPADEGASSTVMVENAADESATVAPSSGGVIYLAEATCAPDKAAYKEVDKGKIMSDLGICPSVKGTVYYYEERKQEAWATLGGHQGLRLTARVAIMYQGEVVAEGEVVKVKDTDAIIRLDKDYLPGAVKLGDDVRVLRNGPRSATLEDMAHVRRERGAMAFLVGALLGGLIAAAR